MKIRNHKMTIKFSILCVSLGINYCIEVDANVTIPWAAFLANWGIQIWDTYVSWLGSGKLVLV